MISHTAIPVISDNAGNITLTHDLVRGGRTNLVANKGSVCSVNSNLEIGSTNILGAGVYAENSNVKFKPFSRILANKDTSKSPTNAVDAPQNNKFAVYAVNSNVTSPDMYGALGISGVDPVTKTTKPKFSGQGTFQSINSKVIVTYDQTDFSIVVDTDTVTEVIKGNDSQLPYG